MKTRDELQMQKLVADLLYRLSQMQAPMNAREKSLGKALFQFLATRDQ